MTIIFLLLHKNRKALRHNDLRKTVKKTCTSTCIAKMLWYNNGMKTITTKQLANTSKTTIQNLFLQYLDFQKSRISRKTQGFCWWGMYQRLTTPPPPTSHEFCLFLLCLLFVYCLFCWVFWYFDKKVFTNHLTRNFYDVKWWCKQKTVVLPMFLLMKRVVSSNDRYDFFTFI